MNSLTRRQQRRAKAKQLGLRRTRREAPPKNDDADLIFIPRRLRSANACRIVNTLLRAMWETQETTDTP